MLLEANADILTSLREYYERLVNNKDFTVGGTSSEDVVDFAIQLKDMGYDLKMQIARGKLLAKVTADRKTLVSLYNYSTNPNLMLYNIQVLIYSRFCSTYRARQRRKWR
jgi:hypothetical protein